MTTEATARAFFTLAEAKNFAVVGASSDPTKYGHKIFAWYLSHGLTPKPVNKKASTVNIAGKDHETISDLGALEDPKNTAVSIITPPNATLEVLQKAVELKIPSVWLQPGSFNPAVEEWARSEGRFKAVVAGKEGGTRAHDGWCVLVDGEKALQAARKELQDAEAARKL